MVSLSEWVAIAGVVGFFVSLGFNVYQYWSRKRDESAKDVEDVEYELYHLMNRIEQMEYGSFGAYRHSGGSLPRRVRKELYEFEKVLDRYNKELRIYEDEIRLSIQDAVLENATLPRVRANQISELGSGMIQWESGQSPSTKEPKDYVDQALTTVLLNRIVKDGEASVGIIRDNAPDFFDQLIRVTSETELGNLCDQINQNLNLPQRKYSRRKLIDARQKVREFEFKRLEIRPPPIV